MWKVYERCVVTCAVVNTNGNSLLVLSSGLLDLPWPSCHCLNSASFLTLRLTIELYCKLLNGIKVAERRVKYKWQPLAHSKIWRAALDMDSFPQRRGVSRDATSNLFIPQIRDSLIPFK